MPLIENTICYAIITKLKFIVNNKPTANDCCKYRRKKQIKNNKTNMSEANTLQAPLTNEEPTDE